MSQHGCPERLSNRSKGFQEDGPSQPTMEVLVETLTGTAFEMTVSPSDTVFAIKSKIFRVEGIPVSQQHLLYNLKELENSSSLREHSICDGARLRLVLGMCGGPITTRRLPPPPNAEPWRDIERLLDSNREDGDWSGSGCKVTVLVFRDGERVNMVRVQDNRDGTYSPLDHNKYSSSLSHLVEQEPDEGVSGLEENAVTMGKMLELRRRMDALSLQRRGAGVGHVAHDTPEIQKTRSEETLSVGSFHEDRVYASPFGWYGEYGAVVRWGAGGGAGGERRRAPALPRADSAHSDADAGDDSDSERLAALAGSILVQGRGEEDTLLEPCRDTPAPIPAADYGPLVGGAVGGWRAAGFGSARSVAPAAPVPSALSASASDLTRHRILPTLSRHRNREHLHLSDEGLQAVGGRPRNLEVGSERRQRRRRGTAPGGPALGGPGLGEPGIGGPGLELPPPEPPVRRDTISNEKAIAESAPTPAQPDGPRVDVPQRKVRVRCLLCSKRLSIATVHRCRCGGRYCAPHRYAEVHGCAYDYRAPPPTTAHTRLPDL